ncbi:hypothetical protein [Flavivirga algicola]|uniref:Uncharacterized protein n=1 Tax=Flavivirga algicola TaxID=2729136 RepID=A0ABX1S290_9FLAO|nr:hypothetical protein [Flavivirga algicola]NMH89985.1 hypothetical protein [Flavivirga algicola]
MKLYTYIILIIFSISCSKKGNRINLPQSDFTNYSIEKKSTEYQVFVDQVSQTEFRIIDSDTLITELDSTLHSKVHSLELIRHYHEYPKIVLSLDQNLSYKTFQELTKEFRKAFKQSFVLDLKGKDDLRITLPPYIQNDSEYIVENLRGKGAPNYYPELEPYFLEKKVLNLKVNTNEFLITDSNSNKISDLKKYAELNKKFVILFEFSTDSNYQDYVNMISFLKSTFAEIIEKEKSENNLTYEEIQEKYRFIIEEKNALQQRV